MSKVNPNMTVDPYLWERFKEEAENASKEFERFIKSYVGAEDEDLQDEKEKLQKRLEELKEEQKEIDSERSKVESRLEGINVKLKKRDRREKKLEKAVNILTRKEDNLERGRSIEQTNAFQHWLHELDIDKETLLEKIEEESDGG